MNILQDSEYYQNLMTQPLKIYFAGDLFDSKDLGGNLLLANAIEEVSDGRYQIFLPQNGECEITERTSKSIRDADFELLLKSDLLIANFDGPDLDSGTVVEFCFAKMVDMPSLLLRTDFRDSGDHTLPDGDPWNLMCSHFPRTAVLHLNAMTIYHECKNSDIALMLKNFYHRIAAEIVARLDQVVTLPSWLKAEKLSAQYDLAIASIGGTVGELLTADIRNETVRRKIRSGLFD